MEGFSLSGFLIFVLKLLLVKVIIGVTVAVWRKIKSLIFKKKEKPNDTINHQDDSKPEK